MNLKNNLHFEDFSSSQIQTYLSKNNNKRGEENIFKAQHQNPDTINK